MLIAFCIIPDCQMIGYTSFDDPASITGLQSLTLEDGHQADILGEKGINPRFWICDQCLTKIIAKRGQAENIWGQFSVELSNEGTP